MDSAYNGEAYAPLPDFERSTGSDFQYTPPIEQSGLAGEWSIGETDDNRIYIESDDFTHDVRLYVDGDFRDLDQRRAYVECILTALTADKASDEALEEAGHALSEIIDERYQWKNAGPFIIADLADRGFTIRSLKGAAK